MAFSGPAQFQTSPNESRLQRLPPYLEGIVLFAAPFNHTRAIFFEIISDAASSCQEQILYNAFRGLARYPPSASNPQAFIHRSQEEFYYKEVLTRRPHQFSLRDMKLHRFWWTHPDGFPIILIIRIAPNPSPHFMRLASRGTTCRTRLSSTSRRQDANAGNSAFARRRVKNLGVEFWRCDRWR